MKISMSREAGSGFAGKKHIAILALLFVISPTIVLAQTATTAAASTNPCSISAVKGDASVSTSLPRCVNQIYVWSLGISVLLAMLMIVLGGYYYMTSGGNAEQSSKGKEYITSALIGLVILFCAYLLLNEINPDLVRFNLDSLKGLNGTPQSQAPANSTIRDSGTPANTQTPAQPNITP